MRTPSTDNAARRAMARVWTCALVLAVLVVASLTSVGAQAATYAGRDPEVLFIDTATSTEVSRTMDLFQNAYVDASGQTVVASADCTKLVAPGTSGSYEFAVRNSGGQPATYKVWAETSQDGTTQVVPLSVSLVSGKTSCANLADEGSLAPGSSAVYRIAWSWPFERGATSEARAAGDASDTSLGNEAATRRVSYTVTLHMSAEAEYPPAQRGGRSPQTGDVELPVVPLLVAGALLLAIGVLLWRRRRGEDGR